MLYRYETHLHCSRCSACATSSSQEMVRAYRKAGYAGFVLTDHFIHGNGVVVDVIEKLHLADET